MASPRPSSSALPPASSTPTPSKPRRPSASAHSSAATSARSRFRSSSTSTPAPGGTSSSSATTGADYHQHGAQSAEPVSHEAGLASIRTFLKGRSSYDVFPVSFRLIVLDTKLMVKKALGVMWQNGASSRLTP